MARKMKNSGIAWIGEIPEDWKVIRLKSLYSFGKGLPITKENLVDKGIPVISYGQIHSKQTTGVEIQEHLIRYVEDIYLEQNPQSLVTAGDFIFADTSEDVEGCGNAIYVDRELKLFAGYHTIIFKHRNNQHKNKFLAYLFKTDAWRNQLRSKATGVKLFSISRKILSEAKVVLPSDIEQQAIADYLDKKCAQIDTALAKTRTAIEEYKKLKQAIITKAVTKGVRGNRPMKDSGIAWIGEIPAEWKINRIKSVCNIFGRIGFRGYTADDLVQVRQGAITLSPSNFHDMKMNYSRCSYLAWAKYYESPEIQIFDGDILFVKTGSTYGKSCLVTNLPMEATINPQSVVLKNFSCNNRFLAYTMNSTSLAYQVEQSVVGGTIPTIAQAKINNYVFAEAPIEEQQEIADYLDKKCATIDTLIAKKEQLITELEAYKKSLIYEYVTGKKEVPE